MKSRWLIIPIEVLARDLPSRLLISCAAAARGYQVLLGHQPRIIQHISRLPNGIVLEKSICNHREPRIRSFIEAGNKICNSDEESDMIYMTPESYMNARMNERTVEMTDKFLCWSEKQRAIMANRFGEQPERLVTTGTSRTDIWRREFHSLYSDRAEQYKKQYGPYVLFNSNFAHCVHFSGADYMEKSVQELSLAQTEEDVALYKRQYKEGIENLNAYVEIFPKIVEWLPDHQLIIRPHPVDDINFWNDATKDLPRTHVVREGTVTPWILGADAMLHHGCMTATEGALLGRPCVYYAPAPDITHDNSVGAFVSIPAKTPEELRQAMVDAAGQQWDPQTAIDKMSVFFASLEGPFAFERIIERLDEVELEPQEPTRGLLNRNIISPTLGMKLKRGLRFKKAEKRSEADRIKWPGLTPQDVAELAGKLIACTPKLSPIDVTAVHDEVFWIRSA